jgi:tetratricopeptide (TPR) repeat protein
MAEIEVRAGPPQGARWELRAAPGAGESAVLGLEFPSGVDDTLAVDLVREEGSWKIAGLRISAEPATTAPMPGRRPGEAAAAGGGAGGAANPGPARAVRRRLAAAAMAGLAVAAALLTGALLWRRRVPRRVLAGLGIATLVASAAGLAAPGALARLVSRLPVRARAGPGAAAVVDPARSAGGELRALLPLRRALAQPAVALTTLPGGPAEGAASAPGMELRPQRGVEGHARRRFQRQASHGGASAAPSPATPSLATPSLATPSAATLAGAAMTLPGAVGRTARLWWAQYLLGQSDLAAAESQLHEIPAPSGLRLAELLRARLGLLRLQETATLAAYRRALEVGPGDEGLLLEAATAFAILGYDDHAKAYLAQLQGLGARSAEAYYLLAEYALIGDQLLAAHESFVTGWGLEPLTRGELLEKPLEACLLDDAAIRRLVRLDSALEPVVGCMSPPAPLALPAGVDALLSGSTLRLSSGTAELLVPRGCELAPAGTLAETAEGSRRRQHARALAGLAALVQAARSPGALAQPALRRRAEQAANALAGAARWTDLVELTAGLSRQDSILPAGLVRQRAAALDRLGRAGEARLLLVRLALGERAARRADPAALYQLADLLADAGDFDGAIRLVGKANAELPRPASDERLVQLEMERRLARSSAVYRAPRFEIRYPALRGENFARDAAQVLEQERQRLQAWIPVGAGPPIEVRLLPAADFRVGYSQGGEVLGLFDGKIRVPLGDAAGFDAEAVSLIAHELAHALISQRTGNHAPHWFQEGLAQHVQPIQGRVNPVASYRARGSLLAFPLIEPTLRGFASPLWIGIAYDEALWSMHFIETRHGRAGIRRLLDAFRAGQSTEDALPAALGTSVPDFDRDLWAWCLDQAPARWNGPLGP